MAEQKLNGADVGAGLQQVHGEGVAQGMRGEGLADAGAARRLTCALRPWRQGELEERVGEAKRRMR